MSDPVAVVAFNQAGAELTATAVRLDAVAARLENAAKALEARGISADDLAEDAIAARAGAKAIRSLGELSGLTIAEPSSAPSSVNPST